MESSVWVYPWDVIDDPRAAAEVASLGVPEASLAAVYHTTRMLLPHNPRRRVVATRHAAAYFPPDPQRYRGLRLQPPIADWIGTTDAFGEAHDQLSRAGLKLNAWTVVLHNSSLGARYPDLVLENAFGDRYEYALCPAQPEVRAYAAALVGDVARHRPLRGLELEACGYMGWEHLSHHEKYGVRVDLLHRFLLSLCFCQACSATVAEQGGDPATLRTRCARALEAFFAGESAAADDPDEVGIRLEALLGEEVRALLAARERVTLDLLDNIRAELPSPQPRLILSAGSSVYETGACVGLSGAGLVGATDGAMVALFGLPRDAAARHVQRLAAHVHTVAGVRAFWPDASAADQLSDTVRHLAAAGASAFRYYQYGLCPRPNLTWIRESHAELNKETSHVVR